MKSPLMNQNNKHVSNATQIGLQTNNYGLDYINTKTLCTDLIKSELEIYRKEAEITAQKREIELLNKLFELLHTEKIADDTVCEEFKNPDMQYTYVEAQKSYIRLGTQDLQAILSNLLVSRIKENRRTLLQIALSEAITVVPMLLPEQLDLLAICFRLRYTISHNINNLASLINYLHNNIIPHVSNTPPKESLFQHMVYAKTGTIELASIILENIFMETYGGLFLNGYTQDEIHDYYINYPQYFTHCLQDNSKYQINAINLENLNDRLKADTTLNDTDRNYLREHFSSNLMTESQIREYILTEIPESKKLFELWNGTSLKQFSLTSVGIVLGASQSKKITGENYNMSIWI